MTCQEQDTSKITLQCIVRWGMSLDLSGESKAKQDEECFMRLDAIQSQRRNIDKRAERNLNEAKEESCSKCGSENHTAKECWLNESRNVDVKCRRCEKPGHLARMCTSRTSKRQYDQSRSSKYSDDRIKEKNDEKEDRDKQRKVSKVKRGGEIGGTSEESSE